MGASSSTVKQTFGQKLNSYLAANPHETDVTFEVGSRKEKVRGLKIALKVASPIMDKMFKEKWDKELTSKSVIPLPELDPVAFKLFLKLLVLDEWPAKEMEALQIPAETVFNLIAIAKHFGMEEMEVMCQSLTKELYRNFASFSQTENFLKLSRDNLEALLTSESLAVKEIDIFKSAYRWAEKQRENQGLYLNGKELRNVLGSAFFKIRFPLMSNTEFVSEVCPKETLTEKEQLEILKLIAFVSEGVDIQNYAHPSFSTTQRKGGYYPVYLKTPKKPDQVVNLIEGINVASYPPYICEGKARTLLYLNASESLTLNSIGFLGPISEDSVFDVSIHVRTYPPNNNPVKSLSKVEKKVLAKRKEVFHVYLDNPVVLRPYATAHRNSFKPQNGFYFVDISLNGPNVQTAEFLNGVNSKVVSKKIINGIVVYCGLLSDQIAQLGFSKK